MNGIDSLNYIARCNGSSFRIPRLASFDLLGQALNQNNTLNNTNIGQVKTFEAKSIVGLAKHIKRQEAATDNGLDCTVISQTTRIIKENSGMLYDLKKILCTRDISVTFYKCLIMFTVSINLSYLSIFSSTQLKGDKFLISTILGLSLSHGMLFSMFILKYIKDFLGYMFALFLIIIVNVTQYAFDCNNI